MSDAQNVTILVVEDNNVMADILRRALQHAGYSVVIAANGVQALDACAATDFAAIVTDYQMPQMNGLDFVRALRNGDRNHGIPVIFVSGKGLELDSEMLRREFAVSNVMFKPFSPRELISNLNQCIQYQET